MIGKHTMEAKMIAVFRRYPRVSLSFYFYNE